MVAVCSASLGQSASVICSTFLMEVHSPVFLGWSLCTASCCVQPCNKLWWFSRTQAVLLYFQESSLSNVLMLIILVALHHSLFTVLWYHTATQ